MALIFISYSIIPKVLDKINSKWYIYIVNVHVSKDIIEKYPGYNFLGKSFRLSDGKTYMRATFKFNGHTHFYCFEDNAFYFSKEDFGCFASI